jgi:hypothetical protein
MRDRYVGNFLPEGQAKLVFQILDGLSDIRILEQTDRVIKVEDIEIGGGEQDCGWYGAKKGQANPETKRLPIGEAESEIENPSHKNADDSHHQATFEQGRLCRKVEQCGAQGQDQSVKGPEANDSQKRHLLADKGLSLLDKVHACYITYFDMDALYPAFLVELPVKLVETFSG